MSTEVVPTTSRQTPAGPGGAPVAAINPASYARLYGGAPPAGGVPASGYFGQTKQERGATGYQTLDVRPTTTGNGITYTRDGTAAFSAADIAAAGGDINAIDPSRAVGWQGLVNANIARARRAGAARATVLDWGGGGGVPSPLPPTGSTDRAVLPYGTNRPGTTRPVLNTDRQAPSGAADTVPGAAPPGSPPTPAGGLFGTPGYNNARQWLADRGYVVGESAAAANPSAKKLSWADIAMAAGIQDFQGTHDPRFPDLQAAFWGHDQAGNAAADPVRAEMKRRILAGLQAHPAFAGAGAGQGGYAGLPGLAQGGVMGGSAGIPRVVPATPGGQVTSVGGRPAVVGEGGQPEAVLPLSVLEGLVRHAAAQGAQTGAAAMTAPGAPPPGVPRLAAGGVVGSFSSATINPGRGYDWRWGFGPEDTDPNAAPNPKLMTTGGGGGTSAGAGTGQRHGAPPPDQSTVYTNPYGEGGGYAPFAGYTPATYDPYQQQGMSPEEQQQLSAITALARQLQGQGGSLYNVGTGAFNQALGYYQTLLNGNRAAMTAAIAPTAEALREQGQGAAQQVASTLGRGGARDAALADVTRQTTGAIGELTRGVQPGAAQAVGALGSQAQQLGAGLQQAGGGFYQSALQALTQSRQFEEGLGESSRQFGAGLTEQSRQFGTGLQESSRQFGAQLAEQVRQGNMSWQQGQQALALQSWQANEQLQQQWTTYYESIRQFNEQLKIQREQIAAQRSAGKGQMIGGLIGAGGGIAVALI